MPRVKSFNKDQTHEQDISEWIHMGVSCKTKTVGDLAKKVGMSPSTLSYRLQHPGTLRMSEFWAIERVIGSLADFLRIKEGTRC
jgi:hypothetical protein